MKKEIFKVNIRDINCPKCPCPTCGNETLCVVDGSLNIKETRQTRINRQDEDFDVEYSKSVFSCILKCSTCSEYISTSGEGIIDIDVEIDDEGHSYPEYVNVLIPKIFSPSLMLFQIPKKTPVEIKISLQKSFQLFFVNKSSAANQLRVSIELLLDKLRIKKTVTKNGHRKKIVLHQRIENMPAKYKTIKEYLFAIKWIGNYGSHEIKELDSDNLLDAYEFTEKVLVLLYDNHEKNLEKKVKQINRKKGPLVS